MGGLAGHMMHLYDNPEMTFETMLGIMTKASDGNLEGTEKTDGVNVFLGFKDGTARSARNPTDAATGGMSIDDLIAREFKGGDKVRQVYVQAAQAFERAVGSLSDEEVVEIFGPDGNRFYNAEIIHPDAANVINYSGNAIVIHRDGHKQFNPETGGVEPLDASTTSAQFRTAWTLRLPYSTECRKICRSSSEIFKIWGNPCLKKEINSIRDLVIAVSQMPSPSGSGAPARASAPEAAPAQDL